MASLVSNMSRPTVKKSREYVLFGNHITASMVTKRSVIVSLKKFYSHSPTISCNNSSIYILNFFMKATTNFGTTSWIKQDECSHREITLWCSNVVEQIWQVLNFKRNSFRRLRLKTTVELSQITLHDAQRTINRTKG